MKCLKNKVLHTVTYVLMCKGTTNNRNEQVQTDFFDLFDVKKKVEVSFTAPDMTNLGGLPVLLRVMRDDDFLLRLSRFPSREHKDSPYHPLLP